MSKNIGLVVSGGGAKGAFAVGALKYMVNELGMTFDMGAGSSTGSLIVPMVLADELPVIVDIYSNVTTDQVLSRNWLPIQSFFSVDPLHDLIRNNFTEAIWERLARGPRTAFVATACFQTARNVFWKLGGAPLLDERWAANIAEVASREAYMRAILASCCEPIFMPPIEVHPGKEPTRQHFDGGVMDVAPTEILVHHGVTDLYVIDLSPTTDPPENKVYGNLLTIFARGLSLFTTEIENNDLDGAYLDYRAKRYLDAVKQNLRRKLHLSAAQVDELFAVETDPFATVALQSYTLIRPVAPLPIENALEFDRPVMRELMRLGYERARDVLSPSK